MTTQRSWAISLYVVYRPFAQAFASFLFHGTITNRGRSSHIVISSCTLHILPWTYLHRTTMRRMKPERPFANGPPPPASFHRLSTMHASAAPWSPLHWKLGSATHPQLPKFRTKMQVLALCSGRTEKRTHMSSRTSKASRFYRFHGSSFGDDHRTWSVQADLHLNPANAIWKAAITGGHGRDANDCKHTMTLTCPRSQPRHAVAILPATVYPVPYPRSRSLWLSWRHIDGRL